MKQLSKTELNFITDLIGSLQFEIEKAKKTGYFSPSYILEKTEKINKIVKYAK